MYDKNYFTEQFINIVNPLKKYFCGGKVCFAKHRAWYENVSGDMEAFARPLWGLVPLWAGGGEADEFVSLYNKGFAEGTKTNTENYWGECHDCDQRFVEMAAIAYGLMFAPEKLWEPLSAEAKDNLIQWLSTINDNAVCDSNWTFFRVLVNAALKKTGRQYDKERMEKDLARIDEFYLSNGWYKDGEKGQCDYYIAFAFHFYSLIYAIAMEKDDESRAKLYKSRAEEFAKDFIYWSDENGEFLPYGRSLTYRFAQCAFWGACVAADIRPFSLEVMKGIIARSLDAWTSKNIFDTGGLLSVGYDYPNLLMAEHYNAHGSPYWGLKAYIFLMLPDDHEFWTAEAAPMPELEPLKIMGNNSQLVSRRNGKTVMYPIGSITDFSCGQIIPKYLKFAYSAHFGFNVMRSQLSLDESAPDSMLVFEVDGMFMVRRHFNGGSVENGKVIVNWSPFEGIDVKTVITPTESGHIRSHEINSQVDCTAYDAGFAVSSDDSDCLETSVDKGAYAKNKFQQCSVTSDEGEGIIIPASPNTNIRYPKTVIPAVKYEIKKGKTIVKTIIKD
ncbi:DUF2264 domain-containing protein [Lachnospiraceae bacterium MD329]|nr:DUF2264 domain-containing protein [Lachnospiraceae bacterium MD329]